MISWFKPGTSPSPTVLFLGPHGKELVARMEGGYIADFYGAYLDQRIEQARALIKSAKSN